MNSLVVESFIETSRKARQLMRPGYILVVDDDSSITELINNICENHGRKAIIVKTMSEAKQYLLKGNISYAIIDYNLPDGFADYLIEYCEDINVPYIISTAYDRWMDEIRFKYPHIKIIPKPWPIDILVDAMGLSV